MEKTFQLSIFLLQFSWLHIRGLRLNSAVASIKTHRL